MTIRYFARDPQIMVPQGELGYERPFTRSICKACAQLNALYLEQMNSSPQGVLRRERTLR
jgi:hypothetical protein